MESLKGGGGNQPFEGCSSSSLGTSSVSAVNWLSHVICNLAFCILSMGTPDKIIAAFSMHFCCLLSGSIQVLTYSTGVVCVCVYAAGAVVIAVSSATGRGSRHGWLPDDLNNGRLDLFFLFLAGQRFNTSFLHACSTWTPPDQMHPHLCHCMKPDLIPLL